MIIPSAETSETSSLSNNTAKKTPKIGAYVSTPDGKGTVVDQNLIKGILNVQLQKNPDSPPKSYKVNEVKLIKDGQIKINKNEQEELKGLEG